jgi:hypothetical protein
VSKVDELLALAEKANILVAISGLNKEQHEVLDGLRAAILEYAARLTPGVSEEVVEKAAHTFDHPLVEHERVCRIMRAALEAVFPLVDDGQAKDAARYRWLRDKQAYVAIQPHYHDLSIDKRTGWTIRLVTGHDNNFDVAVDAAMAAPPKDTTP